LIVSKHIQSDSAANFENDVRISLIFVQEVDSTVRFSLF